MTNNTHPRCPACNRMLFERIYDYCMWCGVTLPENLHLSKSEKILLKEQQKKDGEARAHKSQEIERGLGGDGGMVWGNWAGDSDAGSDGGE
jgi:hypothetical protein